jgi:hypothetical protein
VLWRSAEAAGDPGLRARRMMSYVERFRGIMRVDFPVPLEHLARWMMPPASHPFLERWLALQIDVAPSANAQAAASVVARRDDGNAPPPAFDPSEIAALFSLGGRRRDQVEVVVDTEKAEVRVLRDSGDVLLSFVVYRRGDEPRSCYRSTRRFEISLAGQRHTPEQLALADKILARVDRREQQHAS